MKKWTCQSKNERYFLLRYYKVRTHFKQSVMKKYFEDNFSVFGQEIQKAVSKLLEIKIM
jgi:hypothetical protein